MVVTEKQSINNNFKIFSFFIIIMNIVLIQTLILNE